jgi:hypothetical protein
MAEINIIKLLISKAIFGGNIFPTIIPGYKFQIFSSSLMFR